MHNDHQKKIQRIIKLLAVKAKRVRKGQFYRNKVTINFGLDKSVLRQNSKRFSVKSTNESHARCPPQLDGILVEERVKLQI